MNAAQIRALGRAVEHGFGHTTRVVTAFPFSEDWTWFVDEVSAYTGTLAECNQLDLAYRAGSLTPKEQAA